MKTSRIPLLLIAISVVALAAAPYLAIGGTQRAQIREKNQADIYNLSKLQREQLQRNFEYYTNTLDDAGRQRARTLHASLQYDQKVLKEVMEKYHLWLLTLNAQQRDELYKIADPGQRIEKMERIIRNQPTQDVERSFGLRFSWKGAPLTTASLTKVMHSIEVETLKVLGERKQQELTALNGFGRYIQLLEELRDLPTEILKDPAEKPKEPVGPGRELLLRGTAPAPVTVVANQIHELGVNPEIEAFILKSEQQRGIRLLEVLYKSLVSEFANQEMRNRRTASRPTVKQLSEFFEQIPNQAEKDALLALDSVDFQEELTLRYQKIPPAGIEELVRQFTDQVIRRRGGRGGGGGGGRGFDMRGGRGAGGEAGRGGPSPQDAGNNSPQREGPQPRGQQREGRGN